MKGPTERPVGYVIETDPPDEQFPLEVAPDWDKQLRQAAYMAKLIDRHLDGESIGRNFRPGEELTPMGLCPEQRKNMVTDALAVSLRRFPLPARKPRKYWWQA